MQTLKIIAVVIALLILAAGLLLPVHIITPTDRTGLVYRQNRFSGAIDFLVVDGAPETALPTGSNSGLLPIWKNPKRR